MAATGHLLARRVVSPSNSTKDSRRSEMDGDASPLQFLVRIGVELLAESSRIIVETFRDNPKVK